MKTLLFLILYLIGNSISYSPKKAIAYARQWAYSRNPRYFDYSDMGGDCANFVSQCLIAGGFSMSGCPGTYGQGGTIPLVSNLETCLVQKGWKRADEMPSRGVPAGAVITFNYAAHATLCVVGGRNPLIAGHTTDVYEGSSNWGIKAYFWDPNAKDDDDDQGDDDDTGSINWFPYVNGYDINDGENGYAGLFGYAVTGLKVQGATYTVHEVGGSWLPAVSNDAIAGKGHQIDGVAIQGGVEYRVHIIGGGWLEPVNQYNLDDPDYGFAGIYGRTIDAIAINGKTYASGY